MAHLYGLILAGGRGTRFWPRSRRAQAKQVLKFFGDRSLIQQTVDRLRPVLPAERIWILTNDYLRAEIVKQLPEVPKKQILAEPAQRNTAPAIGLAAHILQSIDPEAVMGVFPADHVIGKPRDYIKLVRPAFKAAGEGKIVVLGIEPRWAETGYGYIEFEKAPGAGRESGTDANTAAPVKSFREKPDAATAAGFLAAGNFYWNAGMFFWKTSVLLDALRQFLPQTATLIDGLPAFSSRRFGAQMNEVFPRCENISIDYAVLEKAQNVVGIPAGDIGWNDVGSWNAVYELQKRDAEGNALRADALVVDSGGNYVDAAKSKLVALLGVRDLIVVDTPDALLIADRGRAQQVGDLVKLLEKQKRDNLL
jgi:mannose-1-phosphate guanylyltransferase